MSSIHIAVLVSGRGRGTNFQALLDGCRSGQIPGNISILISSSPDTPAIQRAAAAGVSTAYLPPPGRKDLLGEELADAEELAKAEDSYDSSLLDLLTRNNIDLVCLAGYMRKIGPRVLAAYPNRIMNTHPSLIPAFCGKGMYGSHVHEAVLAYGVKVSGCTVQFVDENYDAGPIIVQRAVPARDDDTPASLAARVLVQEHQAYVEAVRLFALGRLRVEGRRVRVLPGS